jgi:hypothetical protein
MNFFRMADRVKKNTPPARGVFFIQLSVPGKTKKRVKIPFPAQFSLDETPRMY